MTSPGDESPRSNYGEGRPLSYAYSISHAMLTHFASFPVENFALVSPDRDWQDRLQSLLQLSAPQTRLSQSSYSQPQSTPQYALPPFRQLSSPVHHQSPQQQPHYSLQGSLGGYSTPTKHESPVSTAAMLAPLPQTQSVTGQGHGAQNTSGYATTAPTTANDSNAYAAARWDGFNGYSRIPGMWFVPPPPYESASTEPH